MKPGNKVSRPPPATMAAGCGSPKQKRRLIRRKAFQRGRSTPRKKAPPPNSSKLMRLLKLLLKSEVLVSSLAGFTSPPSPAAPRCHLQGAPLQVNRLRLKQSILLFYANANE